MVSEPKATPRVSVNHVAPRPTAAAIKNVKQEPNSSRMNEPDRNDAARAL